MHLQPVSRGLNGTMNRMSEKLFAQGLTLPSGSAMTSVQFNTVTETIQRFV